MEHTIPCTVSATDAERHHHTLLRGAYGQVIALIPAFNEERFIGSLVLQALQFVDQVIVVDDGSNDRTRRIAERAGALVIHHTTNQGKAAAVNTGFKALRNLAPRAVVMLDGDGQHNPEDIPAVIEPILAGTADIVVGSRFLSIRNDIPLYRQIGQHGLTMTTNLTSGVWLTDSQSGFRALSCRAIERLFFLQRGFSIESEMQFLALEHKLRVVEVPINVIYAEPPKRNPFQHGVQVLNGILRLMGQIRPLLFFGMSGLAVLIISGLLGFYIIDIYQRTQVLAIGYGLVTLILCVIGVLLFFSGIILHSTRGMLLDLRNSVLNQTEPEPVPVLESSKPSK
jgi:glycosyltransferase involved in cell wall biosynthesis